MNDWSRSHYPVVGAQRHCAFICVMCIILSYSLDVKKLEIGDQVQGSPFSPISGFVPKLPDTQLWIAGGPVYQGRQRMPD